MFFYIIKCVALETPSGQKCTRIWKKKEKRNTIAQLVINNLLHTAVIWLYFLNLIKGLTHWLQHIDKKTNVNLGTKGICSLEDNQTMEGFCVESYDSYSCQTNRIRDTWPGSKRNTLTIVDEVFMGTRLQGDTLSQSHSCQCQQIILFKTRSKSLNYGFCLCGYLTFF